jgi:hypothetical protein
MRQIALAAYDYRDIGDGHVWPTPEAIQARTECRYHKDEFGRPYLYILKSPGNWQMDHKSWDMIPLVLEETYDYRIVRQSSVNGTPGEYVPMPEHP